MIKGQYGHRHAQIGSQGLDRGDDLGHGFQIGHERPAGGLGFHLVGAVAKVAQLARRVVGLERFQEGFVVVQAAQQVGLDLPLQRVGLPDRKTALGLLTEQHQTVQFSRHSFLQLLDG